LSKRGIADLPGTLTPISNCGTALDTLVSDIACHFLHACTRLSLLLLQHLRHLLPHSRTSAMAAQTQPRAIPGAGSMPPPPPPTLAIPKSVQSLRPTHTLSLDTSSPVTQNGSYEFDRIIKSGEVLKRTRKTKVCGARAMRHQPELPTRLLRHPLDSHGSPPTWFCARTYYPSTETPRNRSLDTKLSYQILQQ
jgi:hypothetical protein